MSTLAWILAPVVLVAAALALVLAVRERRAAESPAIGRPRPWWGSPLVWLGVAAVSILVGLVIAPRVFGFTFLFLPFVWIGRTGRRTTKRE